MYGYFYLGVSTSDHSLNSNREYESVHPINDSHHRYTANDFMHNQESSLRDSDFYQQKKVNIFQKISFIYYLVYLVLN